MTDDQLRDLIEDRFQVGEMMKHPGWAVYRRRLGRLLEGHRSHMESGNVADMARYKQVAGEITGYHRALNLADELDRLVEAEQDRRRERTDAA